ncbi:MAG TPA: metalloregulator ArsR/SmtB family transcription factor [Mycobacteriales bacterium]|nr:metalloregulator ArsR/SmtB family transcription factor [Mycobacteriales bacterium]
MSYELVLDALGDATRRGLVDRLRHGPLAVGELAAPLPISRPAVSKHLRILTEAGLVTHEVAGTRRLYRLDPRGLDELRRWTEQFWTGALEGFASHVERRTRQPRERKSR